MILANSKAFGWQRENLMVDCVKSDRMASSVCPCEYYSLPILSYVSGEAPRLEGR
jgi:hypothetical protein